MVKNWQRKLGGYIVTPVFCHVLIWSDYKVWDIHMQPTSRDVCDSPNQARIWKKRDHDSLECVNGNSGPNILFIKVIVVN